MKDHREETWLSTSPDSEPDLLRGKHRHSTAVTITKSLSVHCGRPGEGREVPFRGPRTKRT